MITTGRLRLHIKTTLLLLLLLLSMPISSQDTLPKYETRAVWLTTLNKLDWPKTNATSQASVEKQKSELCQILDQLQKAGVNTVMLQTRVRATTIYPSAIEPWDFCLTGTTGKAPGYDPLAYAIEECHERGMELHAWIVTIPVGKWKAEGCKMLRKKMPAVIKKIGDEGYMNPEKKETGDYIAKICKEVVSNYDVDGIHLDYIRYPETWKFNVTKNQGRKYITDIVRKIHDAIKQEKKWVKLTCSPIGKYDNLTRYSSKGWNAKTRVCQDAQEWLRMGIMDGLYPMMYFSGNDFYPFAIDWKEQSYGRTIVSGLGIYFLRDRNWPLEEVKRQMSVSRRLGIGHAYFRSQFFTGNIKGIYDFAANEFDNHPAFVPAMTWCSDAKPDAPEYLNAERLAYADHISWNEGKNNSDGDYLMYNIYASDEYPVDINDARNIVKSRVRGNSYTIKYDNMYRTAKNYAVTAVDRYGNESDAIRTKAVASSSKSYSNNGTMFRMPALPVYLDAQFYVIENTRKEIVAAVPYNKATDISKLRDGIYIVRTIGKKARTHRVGWLKIHTDRTKGKGYTLTTVWKK